VLAFTGTGLICDKCRLAHIEAGAPRYAAKMRDLGFSDAVISLIAEYIREHLSAKRPFGSLMTCCALAHAIEALLEAMEPPASTKRWVLRQMSLGSGASRSVGVFASKKQAEAIAEFWGCFVHTEVGVIEVAPGEPARGNAITELERMHQRRQRFKEEDRRRQEALRRREQLRRQVSGIPISDRPPLRAH